MCLVLYSEKNLEEARLKRLCTISFILNFRKGKIKITESQISGCLGPAVGVGKGIGYRVARGDFFG